MDGLFWYLVRYIRCQPKYNTQNGLLFVISHSCICLNKNYLLLIFSSTPALSSRLLITPSSHQWPSCSQKEEALSRPNTSEPYHFPSTRPFLKHWGIVQMHGLQPLPPNFHFFSPLQKGWIWSEPIGVWIMKGLPGAGRGPVIPHTGGLGFWVGFGWEPLLRDACTHVSSWQPLPKSKARHRRCMYYMKIQWDPNFKHFSATDSQKGLILYTSVIVSLLSSVYT